MGKLILRNNGLETQLVNGMPFTGLTPQNNTYYIGVDSESGLFSQLTPSGTTINIGSGTGPGSGGTKTYSVTYSELVNSVTGGTLNTGSYYLITDFKTVYDRPDYFINGNAKPNIVSVSASTEPIMVLATSEYTLSPDAYQPAYPNDKIKYDYSWSNTEINNSLTYGRISERIDEWNNRTDYDHRNIEFKRYQTYDRGNKLNGYIQSYDSGTGILIGVNTQFSGYVNTDDILLIDGKYNFGYQVGVKVVTVDTDTQLTVVIDPNFSGFTFSNQSLAGYVGIPTNDYYDWKEVYIGQSVELDYINDTTFQLNGYTLSNYIGDYSIFFIEGAYSNSGFLLANNTFGNNCYSNTIGDRSYNNVTYNWFVRNTIEGRFYNNSIRRGLYSNTIGQYFNDNLIDGYMYVNTIGEGFYGNEIYSDFNYNKIGKDFNYNKIYNNFYDNTISNYFNNNILGDDFNIGNWDFYRNDIGVNFEENVVRKNFQNNKIGSQFNNNTIYGDFYKNLIGNGFNNNSNIRENFNGNNIENSFRNNYYIGENFNTNRIGENFQYNRLGQDFNSNNIKNYFNSNKVGEFLTYTWFYLSNVTTRTYDTWKNALDNNVGYNIVGEELVMYDTINLQYYKIKFTKWTENNNGGGFSYERTPIDNSGNETGPTVYFTKNNYGNEIDIIVPGSLEITRGNNQGIFNIAVEGSYTNSSPINTEWNSIYTEFNNGIRFAYNNIGNEFYNNTIGNDFGYGGGQAQGNVINDTFQNNIIGNYMYNNIIGNYFTSNTIADNFENNTIKNYFTRNSIGNNFESNEIGDYFGNYGSGPGSPITNNIFNDFKYNKIGNFFGNDTNFPSTGSGSNGDGGNIINDGFQYNVIGDNVIFNAFDLNFSNNKVGNDFWFNVFGINSTDNIIGNLFVGNVGTGGFPIPLGDNFTSNKLSNYSAFNEIGSDFKYNNIGNFFGNAGSGTQNQIGSTFQNNTIGNNFGDDGSQTSGGNIVGNGFYLNLTTDYVINTDFTLATHVYGPYNCTMFTRPDETLRLSYYDNSDVLNIVNIDA